MRRRRFTPPEFPKTPTAEELQERWNAAALALPKETRQKFLDLLWEGKTVGEARELAGIEDQNAAFALVSLNITDRKFLRRESV